MASLKVRYPQQLDVTDLFEANIDKDLPVDNLEDIYDIDVDKISQDANTMAVGTIKNLLRLYNDEQFTEDHPEFRKRVDTEIESLRKLYKMAASNEYIHDHLLTAISRQSGNASLYMALMRLQANMMAIDKQIKDVMNEFTKMSKTYQTEINFINEETPSESQQSQDDGVINRGSKAFIRMMNAEADESDNLESLDLDA